MGRKLIYKTEQEKKEAYNRRAKEWYHKHKQDPDYLLRRKWYQAKYYDKYNVDKQTFYREYNTDYIFYIRSVRTGKLEKKIAKNKEQLKILQARIDRDERRLFEVKEKFKHLEEKYDN